MKTVLIAGGTGLIGKELEQTLVQSGYEVRILTRNPKQSNHFLWNVKESFLDEEAIKNINVIINLAGEGIADKRWTKRRKEELYDSRIKSTELLFQFVDKMEVLDAYISASGINCYGFEKQGYSISENDPFGHDFISQLVKKWEEAADLFSTKCRVVKLRTSVVISWRGGALPKLAKAVKMGIGSPIGSGKQFVSWVHMNDLINAYIYSIDNLISGSFNIVSKNITNELVTQIIANYYHKKLWLPNIPSFIITLLFGELSVLLLRGINPSNQKFIDTGYKYEVNSFADAINFNV